MLTEVEDRGRFPCLTVLSSMKTGQLQACLCLERHYQGITQIKYLLNKSLLNEEMDERMNKGPHCALA